MYIFNITFLISNQSFSFWNSWVRDRFIPSVIANGEFSSPQLARVHAPENEQDGISVALQFHTADKSAIERWMTTEGELLQQTCTGEFRGTVLFFTTTLEILN